MRFSLLKLLSWGGGVPGWGWRNFEALLVHVSLPSPFPGWLLLPHIDSPFPNLRYTSKNPGQRLLSRIWGGLKKAI